MTSCLKSSQIIWNRDLEAVPEVNENAQIPVAQSVWDGHFVAVIHGLWCGRWT